MVEVFLMDLRPGARLGPYELVSAIGKGGMGEVWKARDPRLGREVAIKVSAQQFTDRFEREARSIASLNHSNICTLHDVGPNYLVMELIEGPTLAERIAEGPIPIKEAVAIAKQIAEALEAAHEKNIVHRDLKPANVKIRPDGSVKVLDFGLAKSGGDHTGLSSDSPTMMTVAGMILGTAGYMAPEQARGKTVDTRADIWAFGVVLYEMITDRRLFQEETVPETLAAVIKEEVDWSKLPAGTPPAIRTLLRRCLTRDLRQRLQAIGEARIALENPAPNEAATGSAPVPASGPILPWIAAAVCLMALAGLAFTHFRETAPVQPQFRFVLPAPEKRQVGNFAISPDGRYVAMVVSAETFTSQLWVRSLDSLQMQLLPETEGASLPFWSDDSRYVAFFADRKLKKVAVTGGPVQTLCDVEGPLGGTWNQDGVILFGGNGQSLRRVAAAGGTPAPLAQLKSDQRLPEFLPDGNRFLYAANAGGAEAPGIHVGSLDGSIDPKRPPLVADSTKAEYAPPPDGKGLGHVLFTRQAALMALPVDPGTLQPAGDVFPAAEQVTAFSISNNGILTYRAGSAVPLSQLTWFDRQGRNLGVAGEPGLWSGLALSPDASRAAMLQSGDAWVMDLTRGTGSRLTFDRSVSFVPEWSPDGKKVLYSSARPGGGNFGLYERDAGGAGADELLYKSERRMQPWDWSTDGRFLAFGWNSERRSGIWVLPLTGADALKPRPAVQGPFYGLGVRFSPDGKFLVYRSDETGRNEIYVETFDRGGSGASGGRWLISKGSLGMAHWRDDGRELYYLSLDGEIMAVPITTTPAFHAGEPVPLFTAPPNFLGRGNNTPGSSADVSGDGKRFIFVMPVADVHRDEITVVTNWQAGLKK